jgi:hypothetical protein
METRLRVVLALFAACAAESSVSTAAAKTQSSLRGEQPGISPNLHPESDSKFFGKDYPDDLRPKVINHFDHPYPTVQDSKDYDKDYVKDENNDNGEWTAQMEYDRLKNKLAREKDDVLKAKAKMEEEEWEYRQVKDFEARAEADAKKAEADSAAAAGDAANKEGAAGDSAGAIASESGEVESETEQLKKCEEQLAKAKKALRDLESEMSAAEGKAGSAAGDVSSAEALARQLEAKEAKLENTLDGETKTYDQLVKEYKLAVKELEDLEAAVDKAARRLQKIRSKDPSIKDGVIGFKSEQKSFARSATLPSLAVFVAALSWWTLN